MAGEYRRREPGAPPLYALMEDRFEEFEDVYDDRYADRFRQPGFSVHVGHPVAADDGASRECLTW